jgi:hypothetical protein
MNILKSTCQPVIGYRFIQLAKCGRMSRSEMWKNQNDGYSDIQKCGKMMSVDVCELFSATFLIRVFFT